MDVGIVMPCSAITPPDLIAETAKAIEERGFASIWAPEHVIFFDQYKSQYPYADHGKLLGFDHGMMEPWTTCATRRHARAEGYGNCGTHPSPPPTPLRIL